MSARARAPSSRPPSTDASTPTPRARCSPTRAAAPAAARRARSSKGCETSRARCPTRLPTRCTRAAFEARSCETRSSGDAPPVRAMRRFALLAAACVALLVGVGAGVKVRHASNATLASTVDPRRVDLAGAGSLWPASDARVLVRSAGPRHAHRALAGRDRGAGEPSRCGRALRGGALRRRGRGARHPLHGRRRRGAARACRCGRRRRGRTPRG